MKFVRYFALFAAILISIVSCSKTEKSNDLNKPERNKPIIVNSSARGGEWNDPSTWIEKTLPDSLTDVVINGKVSLTTNASCLNLIVNRDTTLEITSEGRLTVFNHIVNDGSIIPEGKLIFGKK